MRGRGRAGLPFSDWPEADRAAWQDAMSTGGLFEPRGPAAGLAPITRLTCQRRYGAYLAWLAARGELGLEEGVEDRMTPERLARFIRDRTREISSVSVFSEVAALAMAFKVMAPHRTWTWMRHHPLLPRRAERFAARRAHAVPEPAVVLRPLLMELDRLSGGSPTPEAGRLLRDHLLVAVGIVTALRPRNLRDLRLGETILRRPSFWEVVVPARRSKTGVSDHARVVPGWLTGPLDAFVARFRPRLGPAAIDTGPLWLSARGRPLSGSMVDKAFKRAGALAGATLRPHATRHMLATTMLRHDAGSIALASAALGHTDAEMVALHYGRAGDQGALDAWRAIRERHTGDAQRKKRR